MSLRSGHSHSHGQAESTIFIGKRQHEVDPVCTFQITGFFIGATISFIFVLAELSSAIYMHSLVLLADGFHNLADVFAIYIAYWARRAAKREQNNFMSYGWARTEILGNLTNGCFLLSLSLYIVLEAIPKYIQPEELRGAELGDQRDIYYLLIATIGVAIIVIRSFIFLVTGNLFNSTHAHTEQTAEINSVRSKGSRQSRNLEQHEMSETFLKHGHSHSKKKKKGKSISAALLHYLGDATCSLIVFGVAIVNYFFAPQSWVLYLDPIGSSIIVVLILVSTVPTVQRCSMILLQSAPNEIDVESIKLRMLKLEGLVSVHDFHVWQLVDGMIISSVHVAIEDGVDFTNLAQEVKRIFHQYGIHSSSIQPEFVPRNYQDNSFCEQNCVIECEEDWCCKQSAEKKKKVLEEYSTSVEL